MVDSKESMLIFILINGYGCFEKIKILEEPEPIYRVRNKLTQQNEKLRVGFIEGDDALVLQL